MFFDFDGTLSEIVDDPDAAQLTAGAAEALRLLTAQCPVAVLSGRDLADVRQRIGLPGIWYAGSHGFELTGPDGEHHQNDEAAATIPVLQRAAAELGEQLHHIPGVVVEHKRFGVAVHYRNAARDRVGEVLAAVRAAGQRRVLRVTTGREVIELRPNVDWDKGKTLRWVLGHIRDAASGGWYRSISVTTSPTRMHSTLCTTTESRSWCATARTVTVPPPRSMGWTTRDKSSSSPSCWHAKSARTPKR
ncbi:trehalose-phosphatase [Mycobacterium xenopi 3993]|nr:trehalose-phosphatase [Mycobacterium xenopi 3993]